MSKCIIIAGGTGTGKTTLAKTLINKRTKNILIYDVNNEYGYPYTDMVSFLNKAKRVKNHVILFEEATIFFSTSGGEKNVREIMVRKRHTNNILIFNFHSLSQIPLYILMFCDYLFIKKSNDQISQIERKFKGNANIFKAYAEVYNSPDKYTTKCLKLL